MFFTAKAKWLAQLWKKAPSYYCTGTGTVQYSTEYVDSALQNFLMPSPAAIYIKIGITSAVVTVLDGTGRKPGPVSVWMVTYIMVLNGSLFHSSPCN
jgi:hypothetical protein